MRKGVTFHGRNQKLVVVEIGTYKGEVDDWQIKGRLRKIGQSSAKPLAKIAVTGKETGAMLMGTIPFSGGQFSGSNREKHFFTPKKELSIAMDTSGRIGLVALSGAIDDSKSDLWFSESRDGKNWKPPLRLTINSSSQEYYPRLVPAENGDLQLFWISKRRGRGWELWTSALSADDKWSHPSRIALEKFSPWKSASVKLSKNSIPKFLEYSVTQNQRGQWILAYYSYATKGLVVLQSADLKTWNKLSDIDTGKAVFGPSLVQDGKGKYRLAVFSNSGKPLLYSSNDGKQWSQKSHSLKCSCQRDYNEVHSIQLIPKRDGKLLLLLSDNFYGLQYAEFDPDASRPRLDLVSRALTQAYAVVPIR